MKKNYLFLIGLFFIAGLSAQTVTKTILMDCQYDATHFPSGSPWNDFYYNASNQEIFDNTSASVGHITCSGWTQGNSSGTTAPTAPAINDFPTNVQTQDNIYGQGASAVASIAFTGLNPARVYTFTIFSSRAGVTDNRETLYTATGANTGNAALNPSSNTGNVATISSIQPDVSGNLLFTAQAGPNNVNSNKYFYLACMKIEEIDNTTGVKNNTIDYKIYYSNNAIFTDNLAGTAKVFSITGAKVAEGQIANGQFNVHLNKGIYIVSVGSVNQKISVQ